MYDHIVIATDGSEAAEQAAARGLEFARRFDATVDVVHVIPGRAVALAREAEAVRDLRERSDAVLQSVIALAAEHGQSVATERLEGKPAVELSEYAASTDASLLVVGRQGLTGLGRRLLGGVTEQVLHRCDVPVLVDTGGDVADAGYERVLVPTDGSENAVRATPHGTAIGARYGATLHALSVVDVQSAGGAFSAGGLDAAFVERLEARGESAVEAVVSAVHDDVPDLSVETAVVRSTSFGGVAPGITEYVEAHDIDLVVMGSHGRSNLGRQVLGSVASTLLRTLDVPVMVVRRDR
jgi:nucleotide-binding universal stress UspA family protein